MYRAKEKGRDRAEWFDPSLHRDVVASFEVERDLRQAIEHDELYLEFQPVLDLEIGYVHELRGVRPVATPRARAPRSRRVHSGRREHEPDRVGRSLGVARTRLPTAAGWPDAVRIAVNLSPRELAEPDLVAFVKETPGRLRRRAAAGSCSRSPRTAVIQDPTAAARTIAALRTLGVGVVIDDFGTGYTSLSFLRDYQLDGLKIDRSFVTDLEHGSTAIVDAMIRMSAALGLEVIAEGIETDAELAQLKALGCRFIQGFLVSEPVAPEDLPWAKTRVDP